MSEEDQSSKRLQNLVSFSIFAMISLFILFPFAMEVRIGWYFYPEIHLESIILFSWTWVYELVGSQPGFMFNLAFYLIVQQGLFQTISQVVFFGAYIGFSLGLTTRKYAVRLGIISLIPALFIMGVNLLGALVPGARGVIIPIPLQVISILGLIILRLTSPKPSEDPKPSKDDWLPE